MIAKKITLRGETRIALEFTYNAHIIHQLKQQHQAVWSDKKKVWHVAYTIDRVHALQSDFPHIRFIKSEQDKPLESKNITAEQSEQLAMHMRAFTKWMKHKRYSESTINTYCESVKTFLIFMLPKSAEEIIAEDMVVFVNEYILKNKYSYSYQNQVVNASKLFFKEVLRSRLNVESFERPRSEHKLPNVLSKEEVKLLLQSLRNTKHKTMLSLIYSCGLRRSELLHLKPEHVDSKRGVLLIKQAKGKKDRIAPLSEKTIEMLRKYYLDYKPKVWLFEGMKSGDQYSEQSLQSVLKKAVKQAGIKKPVTLHWLRHSYATHLLENGTDLRYIQEILGHKSSKTTEIYTHVSNKSIQKIKSPFDDL